MSTPPATLKRRRRRRRRKAKPPQPLEVAIAHHEDVRVRFLTVLKDGCPCCRVAPRMSSVCDELKLNKGNIWRWAKRDYLRMDEKALRVLEEWVQRVEMVTKAFETARAGGDPLEGGETKR